MTLEVIPLMLLAGFLAPLPYNYWRLKALGESCHCASAQVLEKSGVAIHRKRVRQDVEPPLNRQLAAIASVLELGPLQISGGVHHQANSCCR